MGTVKVGSSETDGTGSDDDEIIIGGHCGQHCRHELQLLTNKYGVSPI